ncbi:hypothetical protein SAMN05444365_103103 [Micromonospora pattaloongensis]|uniref:DinB superfamily protein n=1 Tax=Micromonospora pattaloongensis TaxID=405436 RepID=A0A1H3LV04_9ACTN|nr:hypothetical protein [Micromonospora pattaloongensis]SDY68163.1 hypothetical protein SAMN05444365_103103 [Micromonospora pattaloongensis]
MEAAELRRAYDALLAEIEAGGFAPPPPGQWRAEQVAAHVVANDELLLRTTEAVLAGSPWVYYNHNELHNPQLDAIIAECGGLPGLADRLRESSERVSGVIGRLGVHGETLVHTLIRDGFALRVDEPLPWGRVLDLHGRLHLPTHTDQLRALRA